jgi:threonine synthase
MNGPSDPKDVQETYFNSVCLYCGKQNRSANYSCNCRSENWFSRYRTIDLRPDIIHNFDKSIESFIRYSFDHPKGILQYKLLPYGEVETNQPAVGMTPLLRSPHFSRIYGSSIFLKYEGTNPSGCFKDRETLPCLLHTKHSQLRRAVIYSSGNAAASAASLIKQKDNLELLTFVSGDTYPEKIEYIRQQGTDVVIVGDEKTNYETGYRLFSKLNSRRIFTTLGFDNWSVRNPYRVQGDKTTALEIVKQLSYGKTEYVSPDYVIVPTANGSCLTGIWKGFKELNQLGIISSLPKMISVGVSRANPVFKAVKMRRFSTPVRCNLNNIDSHDANAGSTMLAEEGYDVMEAAKAVIDSKGEALTVQTKDVQQAYFTYIDHHSKLALQQQFLPEPAAMLPLAALDKLKEKVQLSTPDKVVAIITGSASKALKAVHTLLEPRPDLQQKVRNSITPYTANQHNRFPGKKCRIEASEDALIDVLTQKRRVYA